MNNELQKKEAELAALSQKHLEEISAKLPEGHSILVGIHDGKAGGSFMNGYSGPTSELAAGILLAVFMHDIKSGVPMQKVLNALDKVETHIRRKLLE